MKIGILTQPLHNNYGGLLQNLALQKVLKDLGHEPMTININNRDISIFRKSASILKRSILKIIEKNVLIRAYPTKKENIIISRYMRSFVKENIITTKLIKQKVNYDLLKEYDFDAYIVGSDQVWRPRYSTQLSTFFLDFLEGNTLVKKIAYAASFGVSEWEFKGKQTSEFGRLLKQFDAVSVREDSAMDLCEKYFGVKALHLLDPTMLLDKEVYTSIVDKKDVKDSPGNLFTYILDKSVEKNNIVKSVSIKYNLNAFSVMPHMSFADSPKKDINDCVFPPVEEWLRGFMDAEFVVTDSFHGTVFSILFNKPFISIANKTRGLTRFTSLLKMFQLEDRLVFSQDELDLQKIQDIDWHRINNIFLKEKNKSMVFLKNSLNLSKNTN
jgi:polysaccharide pyruvyl transferase WcaK-like protein